MPILIGHRAVIETRIRRAGLRIVLGMNVECFDPREDEHLERYGHAYQSASGRVTPSEERLIPRLPNTAIAALMLKRGDADAMLCGLAGSYNVNLGFVREVIGLEKHARCFGALNVLILSDHTLFVSDTYVNE